MVNPLMGRSTLRTLFLAFVLILSALQPIFSGATTDASTIPTTTGGSVPADNPKRIGGGQTYRQHSESVNIYAGYTAEPAPMGIADYGVGPSGAYQYSTNSSLGVAYISSLLTQNSTGSKEMSVQLNVNLQFSNNNKQYVYWVQNVADIQTNTSTIVFVDNIWNSTVHQGSIGTSSVSGSGSVARAGSQYFYGFVASHSLPGNNVRLAYPTYVNLEINATLNSMRQPQVRFAYNDGHGWIVYDTVTFSSVNGLTSMSGFVVNGFNYKPDGAFYDSELVLGGPAGGLSTTDIQSDVRLQLEYWNGHNYQMVTTAYNFGSNTAETIKNALSQGYYYVDNGALFGWITPGSGTLRELYDPTQLSIVEVQSPLASGVLSVKAPLRTNPVPSQYSFVNGDVTVVLQPGYYELDVYSGGSLYSSGNFSLVQGQHVRLQTPLGAVKLSVSYSVTGGGSGYAGPVFTYKSNNLLQSVTLGTSPATYSADPGSTWSVSYVLPGSSTSERWVANQTTTGTATGFQTLKFLYQHQFLATVSYTLVGGGTPSPVFSSKALGSLLRQSLAASPVGVWVDSGALFSVTNPVLGANPNERWGAGASTSGTITSPTTVSPTYYHQFGYALSYTVVGGGAPAPPTFTYTSLASQTTAAFPSTPVTIWPDSGSSYSLTVNLAGSSPTERWQTNSATAGTVSGPGSLSPAYYHQYLISATFAVNGGGTPSPPAFSYSVFGARTSAAEGTQSPSFWADSGPYSSTNPLSGTAASERWYAATANGTVLSPGIITFAYQHQFFLAITGGEVPSQWYDSGSTAVLTPETTFGRSLGSGLRIMSYSIDGGPAVSVPPTQGTVAVDVAMGSTHSLAFSTVTQYQVTLDSTAKSALNAITPPTIAGDNYWYDSGALVKATLNGIWGRASGSGSRLVSYVINGGNQIPAASSGTVTVLSVAFITSPQSITANVGIQFQLVMSSGSVSSVTPPPIPGDTGWYDQGASVKLSYNYVWNVTAERSRMNALGYAADGGQTTTLPRSGNGTFAVSMTMDGAHAVDVAAVMQYRLSISGGFGTQLSAQSPTNDGFHDSGSSTTVGSQYTWNVVPDKTRESLVGYTLDDVTTNVTRAEGGTFTTPVLTFNRYHGLTFNSVTQYFVTFGFTDSSGSGRIFPSGMQLNLNGRVDSVPGFKTWLDSGTTFRLVSLLWEGVDVKPANGMLFRVEAPAQQVIHARVYNARLRVTDLLQVPVAGAEAKVVLANGTVITRTTSGDGSIEIMLVPLGKFNATVSFLGGSTVIRGDASLKPVAEGQTVVSYPDIALPSAIVIAGVALFLLLRRRKFSLKRFMRRRRWPSSGWDIRRRMLTLT